MKRKLLATVAPPVAICKYSHIRSCAAPTGVFWLAALAAVGYGLATGAWLVLLLGIALWSLAIVWAFDTVLAAEQDEKDPRCEHKDSTACRIVTPQLEEGNPLDEARKAQAK